jgi:hypothetical protein
MNGILRLASIAVLAGLGLGGCAATKPDLVASGPNQHVVQCNGSDPSWEVCQAAAAKACGGKGYDVLKQSDSGAGAHGETTVQDGFHQAVAGVTVKSMLVACKGG